MAKESVLRKAVFIDRDGVLNRLVYRGTNFVVDGRKRRFTAPWKATDVRLIPQARPALELMEQRGFLRFLVTNQPDVAKGNIAPSEFGRIMAIFRALPLNDLYACTHMPNAGCECRKPKPGMLLTAAHVYGVDLSRSYMIGDSETDINAGAAAGVTTIRICKPTDKTKADYRVKHVLEAAQLIL